MNCISDLSSLFTLPTLAQIYISLNPLSNTAIHEQIPLLEEIGIRVEFYIYSDFYCPVSEGETEGEGEGEGEQFHPGDTDADNRIIMGEAIAYLAGWQQGGNPMAYSIRAVYILQKGEGYMYDAGQAPPMCWVPAVE